MTKPIEIKLIRFHPDPHNEEHAGYYLATETPEGRKAFPNAKNAEIAFWPFGQVLEVPEDSQALSLGFDRGGSQRGRYDEHGLEGLKYRECSASLLAKDIAIKSPAIEYFLRAVIAEDREKVKKVDAASRIAKLLYDNGDKFKKVHKWLSMVYQAELADIRETIGRKRKIEDLPDRPVITVQRGFELIQKHLTLSQAIWWRQVANDGLRGQQKRFRQALRLLESSAATWEEVWQDRGEITLVVVRGDNPEISAAARSKGADIVVRVQESGNVQITTNHRRQIDLTSICQALRVEEMQQEGSWKGTPDEPDEFTTARLRTPGTMPECPRWHLLDTSGPKGTLLNASRSCPDVPPTLIPLSRIIYLIKTIGGGKSFHSRFENRWCKKGQCAKNCPWRSYHLPQCDHVQRRLMPGNVLGDAEGWKNVEGKVAVG